MNQGKVCVIQYNSSRFLTRVDRAARTLAQAGYEVVLIAIKDDETPAFEQRNGYTVKRVELASRRLPRGFGLKFVRFAEGIWRTFVAAWREDADIYDARDAYPLFAAHLAAKLRGARLVYDSDELNLDRNWKVSSNAVWRFLMKSYEGFYIRHADAAITSDFGRSEVLSERYRIQPPTVLLNVPEVIQTLSPDLDFRARALGDRRYLLIYQGILVPNRGLPEMIEAMRQLPECRLALVGYGAMERELKEKVRREGLDDAVVFFDAVPYPELMRYTAACDLGVIPLIGSCLSYVYAAPNKLFEYMMSALPVVATDLPDMARVVTGERVGALIGDPTDPTSIATAVRAVLEDPAGVKAVGERARAAALERYNWDAEKEKLLAVYAKLQAAGAAR